MYNVNVSGFEKLVERELNSYLKCLNRLGCLSVSVREVRLAVSSGVAVSVGSKRCGRPRKSIRKVNEVDIIADLTAKADCDPSVSKAVKAEGKAAKLAEKAEAKAAKLAAKEQAKAAKLAAKATLKAEKAEKAKKALARKTKEAKELKKKSDTVTIKSSISSKLVFLESF